MTLNTNPNLAQPDDFFEMLIDAHRDLSDDDSALLNCKLILLLCNHIGDMEVCRTALTVARDGIQASPAGQEIWRPIRT